MTQRVVMCRACGSPGGQHGSPVNGFATLQCTNCGSTSFTAEARDDADRYDELYGAEVADEQFDGSLSRLRLRSLAALPKWAAPAPRMRTTDLFICRQIIQRYDRGSKVVDVGCGSGRLLQYLRNKGLCILGVEVSERLVEDLKRAGLPAVVMPTDVGQLANETPPPKAIIMAEVLEHLDDPLTVLVSLRAAWPEGTVYASVPSPFRRAASQGRLEPWDWPPNHLTRFTPEGLRTLLERAGYNAEVHIPKATGADGTPMWWGRLTRRLIHPFKAWAPRRPETLVEESTPEAVGVSGSRVVAASLLWMQWAHDRTGLLIAALRNRLERDRRPPSSDSMIVIGHPSP